MNIQQKIIKIKTVLAESKTLDIKMYIAQDKSAETEELIIATARSSTHLKGVAYKLKFEAKEVKLPLIGIEGIENGRWAVIDLAFVVIHIMLADIRDFYQLEKLWSN